MLNNIVDPITGLPLKFGELFSDRNLKLVGSARWNETTGAVETRNVSLILTPIDGGSPAITVIPDGSYGLSRNGSIWVQVRRTAGTTTVVSGSSLLTNVSSQEKPKQNWIQLFIRTANDEIVTFGNWLILGGTTFTKIGVTTASGVYDSIVGPATNPFATHTSIQGAIDDASDGSRILILQGTYSIDVAQKPSVATTSAFAWSGKTVTLEGEGFGTVIVNNASLSQAFYIQSTSSTTNNSLGNGSKIIGIHLRNFNQTVVFDGGVGNGVRSCVVEVYNTSTSTSILSAPSRTGSGTFDLNTVKEYVTRGNTFSIREYLVSSSTLTDTLQSSGNQIFDSTSSRRLSIKTSLRVGDTSTPTRTVDVVGDIRTTLGSLYSAASYMGFLTDTNTALPVKSGSLVISSNYADSVGSQSLLVRGSCQVDGSVTLGTNTSQQVTINSPVNVNKTLRVGDNNVALQTLDVSGAIRTTAGQIYTNSAQMLLYTDASASLPLKAASLVLSNSYADSAGTEGLLVRGAAQIDGSVTLGVNTAQTITMRSPAYAVAGLRVGDSNLATRTLDVAGSIRTTAGQLYTNSAQMLLYTDASASLPLKAASLVLSNSYADSAGTQGLLVRGAAQIDGSVTLTSLTANRVVLTNANKVLGSIDYTPSNLASTLVQRNSSGGIAVGNIDADSLTLTGNLLIQNTKVFQARNASGTYENFLWPRWSDNITYLNYGSAGFDIRNNNSITTIFLSSDNKVNVYNGIWNPTSAWSGNPGLDKGKLQYHSDRWYIVSGSNSNRIVQFRRDGSDVAYVANNGFYVGAGLSVDGAANAYGGMYSGANITSEYEFYSNQGWFRTYGDRGWYNQTWEGGIHMSDATWVRVYNNKSFYCNRTILANRIQSEEYVVSDRGSGRYCSMRHSGGANGNGHIDVAGGAGGIYLNWFTGTAGTYIGNGASNYGTIRAASFSTQSDERYKQNIVPTTYGLDTVQKLEPVNFEMNGQKKVGFVAQRTKIIIPEAVSDDESLLSSEGESPVLTMDYSMITPVLVKAVQELSSQLGSVKAELDSAKSEIAKLLSH